MAWISVVCLSIFFIYTALVGTITSAPSCLPVTKLGLCNLQWNVSNLTLSTQDDKLQRINSTLTEITTLTVKDECVAAIQRVLCVSSFPKCNNTNETLTPANPQECHAVEENCTDLVAKTYASDVCSSIQKYNDSVCIEFNVSSNGYCPDTDVYKIEAKNLKTFLEKANQEKVTFERLSVQLGNISSSCVQEYKRIHCQSFVPRCPNTAVITKEKCEQDLYRCSNSTLNTTELCLKFPREQKPLKPTPVSPTTPLILNGSRTTLTFRLRNIKYNQDYENKTSSSYIMLSSNITMALNLAYANLDGFQGVEILELVCNKEMAVKHDVITQSKTETNVIEAMLTIANTTGFFKNKITSTNKPCSVNPSDDHDDDSHSSNWVYMIVFVCVTALLLLAMVLCKQS